MEFFFCRLQMRYNAPDFNCLLYKSQALEEVHKFTHDSKLFAE